MAQQTNLVKVDGLTLFTTNVKAASDTKVSKNRHFFVTQSF